MLGGVGYDSPKFDPIKDANNFLWDQVAQNKIPLLRKQAEQLLKEMD